MEGTETYDKIMDRIHGDYRAQTSGEKMRVGNLSSTKQLRRRKQSNVSPVKWKSSCTATIPKVQGHTKLPPNTGNLIPNAYYQQFKGWYEASRVQEADRSEEQKTYLSTFKWKHTVDPKAKRPWVAPNRQRDDQRRNYDDRRSRRARGHSKRSRSPSSDSYSDDSASRPRPRSRRARRHGSRSRSQNRSRSRSPVARRGHDGDETKSSTTRSRRASLFKRS